MRIIWIRFLPHRDGHSAFQLTLQVLEAPLFPWASCRILIPLKSNCKSLMNYDLVSKIVCHCAIHLTHMMCLSIFGNDWWKTLFLISLCFFQFLSISLQQYVFDNFTLTNKRERCRRREGRGRKPTERQQVLWITTRDPISRLDIFLPGIFFLFLNQYISNHLHFPTKENESWDNRRPAGVVIQVQGCNVTVNNKPSGHIFLATMHRAAIKTGMSIGVVDAKS